MSRLRHSLEDVPASMRRYAVADDGSPGVNRLSSEIGWSRATLYRRFGESPVGGAYVMALCVVLLPSYRAVLWLLEHRDVFGSGGRTRKLVLRGLSYVFLAALADDPVLVRQAHVHALRGARVRDADLVALLEPRRPSPLRSEIGLQPRLRSPRAFAYIPILLDATGLTLRALSLPVEQSAEVAQALVETSLAYPGTNILGCRNRFLDRALPMLGVQERDDDDAAVNQAWLLAQASESLAVDGCQEPLGPVLRALAAPAAGTEP